MRFAPNPISVSLTGKSLYSAALPAPGANLTIAEAAFAASFLSRNGAAINFASFDPTFIKNIRIASNFAGGLVPTTAMRLRVTRLRMGADLTGTIANTAGSATVTGTSTLFVSETCPGMTIYWKDANGIQRSGVISAVASNTSLTLTAVSKTSGTFAGNTTAGTATPLAAPAAANDAVIFDAPLWQDYPQDARLGGSIPTSNVDGLLTVISGVSGTTTTPIYGQKDESRPGSGIAAKFLTQLTADKMIRLGGHTLRIGSVTNQAAAVIAHGDPASVTAGVPIAATDTACTPVETRVRLLCEIVGAQTFTTSDIADAHSGDTLTVEAVVEVEHEKPEV